MTSPEESANDVMAEIMATMGMTNEEFRQNIAEAQNLMDDLIDDCVDGLKSGAEPPAIFAAATIALTMIGSGEVVAMLAADITFRAQERMLKEEIDDLSEGD